MGCDSAYLEMLKSIVVWVLLDSLANLMQRRNIAGACDICEEMVRIVSEIEWPSEQTPNARGDVRLQVGEKLG